jgi:hypothetical protein
MKKRVDEEEAARVAEAQRKKAEDERKQQQEAEQRKFELLKQMRAEEAAKKISEPSLPQPPMAQTDAAISKQLPVLPPL